jgi:hypothetical protein
VADPIADRDQLASALRLIEREAEAFLAEVDEALVRPPGGPAIASVGEPGATSVIGTAVGPKMSPAGDGQIGLPAVSKICRRTEFVCSNASRSIQ